MPELILVGRVARAHGSQGQVIVNPETDFPHDRFAEGNVLVVEQNGTAVERRLVAVRFHQGRPIVALDGVATMDAAEALAGAELKMPADTLGPLPGNTYYRHDLVGCEVIDTAGVRLGSVTEVQGPVERSLLVVSDGQHEILIPMVEGIVTRVDPGQRLVVVDLPEGLAGLNVSGRR
ncbi:MAG TPA: ribosome maturation factor RimM [Vicinamibacterales bacterium]|jgi:16S rRNA processing protein RimM